METNVGVSVGVGQVSVVSGSDVTRVWRKPYARQDSVFVVFGRPASNAGFGGAAMQVAVNECCKANQYVDVLKYLLQASCRVRAQCSAEAAVMYTAVALGSPWSPFRQAISSKLSTAWRGWKSVGSMGRGIGVVEVVSRTSVSPGSINEQAIVY